MPENPTICPKCLQEFEGPVGTCERCGTNVISRHLVDQIADRTAHVSANLPPPTELECLREAPISWARSLSLRLSMGGIAHRLEDISGAPHLKSAWGISGDRIMGIYVRQADLEEARRIDRAYLSTELPDVPDDTRESADTCPACGAALPPGATECPSCGLQFPE